MTSARRAEVLDLVRRHGETDVPTLAARLGLHATTVRFHLDGLVADGLATRVEAEPSGVRGRPRRRYRATEPAADAPGYRTLATVLATSFGEGRGRRASRARRAGRAWADRLAGPADTASLPRPGRRAAVDSLVAHLDRLGFAPRRKPVRRVTRIEMWSCPYLEVARLHPEVTCGLHHGLLEGLLANEGTDAEVDLVPFATNDYCTATLRIGGAPRRDTG